MNYQGGKARVPELGECLAVLTARLNLGLADECCGGLWISRNTHLAGGKVRRVADKCQELIWLYEAVRDGWEPPPRVTSDEYRALMQDRERLTSERSPLLAFVGFGCSYGGRWWRGRKPDDERYTGETARYAAAKTRRDLLEMRDFLRTVEIECSDVMVRDPLTTDLTIYDTPYEGVAGFDATGEFDHAKWKPRVTELATKTPVLVTEFSMPDPWRIVKEWRIPSPGLRKLTIERLWAHESGVLFAALAEELLRDMSGRSGRRRARCVV